MTPEKIKEALLALRLENEARLKAYYNRSLPFADGTFDRWERAKRLGFGEGVSIYDSSCVFGDVTVGKQSWVGPFTLLDGSGGGLKIGEFCSIAAGVHIYTHDTVAWALTGGLAERRVSPVSIGSRVYIGSQSVVTCGVAIGDQSVVAANSLVNRDVAPRTIVAGTPAVVIGTVNVEGSSVQFNYLDRMAIPADLQAGGT
jgi:acetyltransferase-like isoleucine patch superfamily enzyme